MDALLRPAVSMINRQIRAKSPARELCAELADRVMALRVSNTALAIYLLVADDQVVVSSDYAEEPDVVVTGSLLALSRLAGPAGDAAIWDGEVDLIGDALIAQQFQQLLRYGRPDLEEELSGIVGDVAAHEIGEFVRSVGDWGREARDTMRQNVGEYLQEESRAVPSRDEVDHFRRKVDALRDDVARFEARLSALEPRSATQETA
jgi:ubiquinone biosynthesis protein UbiJ